MNKRDAKALGRLCAKHDRKYERIHLLGGAAVTGCRACVDAPEFQSAMSALQVWIRINYGIPNTEEPA